MSYTVCTDYETSLKLKEAGFPQDCCFLGYLNGDPDGLMIDDKVEASKDHHF